MKMLYVGTQGSNDPTQAAFPFVFSKGAIEAGQEPTIFLSGEATYLLKDEVSAATQAVGWPKQSELPAQGRRPGWADIVRAKARVFV